MSDEFRPDEWSDWCGPKDVPAPFDPNISPYLRKPLRSEGRVIAERLIAKLEKEIEK